ncbi:MAG: HAD family phosphatase [Alphaproteobacteria bacterium]|nr:HAD family phosphatase [Alphaproteobacteria bacterium]
MTDNLIIWDFDGVIADTEIIWLKNRMNIINETFNLDWDLETTNKFLGGMSDKTKDEVLKKLGIKTNPEFWEKNRNADKQSMMIGFELTEGIEDIFKMKEINQCIATGGDTQKTINKIKTVNIEKYFPMEKVFTADMVQYGKPEPDIFLLAAKTMGYPPEKSIVIEDSITGLIAAIKAKMTPIAFIGSKLYNKESYVTSIKKLGVTHIFDNMKDIKNFIFNYKL